MTRWWDRGQRDQAARDVTLWGTAVRSAIETAVAANRDDNDWPQLLTEATTELTNIDGLLRFYEPVE